MAETVKDDQFSDHGKIIKNGSDEYYQVFARVISQNAIKDIDKQTRKPKRQKSHKKAYSIDKVSKK